MKTLKMMMLFGGGGILGYMYLKKHPEMLRKMKEMMPKTTKKMFIDPETIIK